MRVAVDTNVLLSFEGINDKARKSEARQLIAALRPHDLVIPAQVLGEMFRALTAKARWSADQARRVIIDWTRLARIGSTDGSVVLLALDLAADHQLHIFDAIVLASAAAESCALLVSEDLQDGFICRGVTVVNPFASPRHPLLETALRPPS